MSDPGASRACPNCGAIVVRGQRFCGTCGADVESFLAVGAIPPPPEPTGPPPGSAPALPAWVGAAALAIVAIATGLEWLAAGAFSADGFDVSFAFLFSDTASGGLGLGVVLVAVAAAGLAAALLLPDEPRLGIALIAAGAVAALLLVWYLVRAYSNTAPGVTVASYGVWIAVVGAVAAIVSGVLLRRRPVTR